jgi:hypothetical protein
MKALGTIFLLMGGVALLVGLVSLPHAPIGVGGIAVACVFGILARLAQVSGHRGDPLKMAAAEAVLPRSGRTNLGSGFAALLSPDQIQCPNCGRVAKCGPAECAHCGTAYP